MDDQQPLRILILEDGLADAELPAGRLLEVSVTGRPVDFAGRRALLAEAADVTERHRLETRLRQAQTMEAVGRLAGGVAHDFNNLLTTVLGYAGLLAAGLADRPELRRQVEEIAKAGQRGAALTRELLALSRELPLQPPRLVDLNAVVAGVEASLRRLLGGDVELATRLQAAAGVLADPFQIEQAIVNLAINARDAMPQGGRLVIETADVELAPRDAAAHAGAVPGPQVLLAVSDTGRGLDEAARAHVFEPFFTAREAGKGSGLELATVFGIVQQSGGRIEVHGEPGRGSRFEIYLPRAAGAAPAQPPPGGAAVVLADGALETVLVLEDDPALRELVRILLEGGGYTVLLAETVEKARSLAERHRGALHLLLTDVQLAGASGPEAAARLRAGRPEARVLYMSGHTGDLLDRRGLLPTGAPLLPKPFTEAALLSKVRAVLDAAAES